MEAPAGDPQVSSSQDVAELHLLLSEMDDELTSYRWREAVWISIVVHVLACLGLVFVPKWIPSSAVIVPAVVPNRDNVFTLAAPDNQRVKTTPRTDVMSDKNRIAQSRTPVPNKDLLRKLQDQNRPGPPVQPRPAPQPQAQQQQNPGQAAPQQPAGAETAPQPQQTQQTAQLQNPAQNKGDFSPFKKAQAPGIEHAIQSLGEGRGTTHYAFSATTGGDYGPSRLHPNSNIKGDVEILSDTMGVDFGPYLQRVLYTIRKNWVNLIPEGAYGKKGKLAIQFAILKDGSIRGMQRVLSSQDLVLDRAAWGGITDSDPLDRLPTDFRGEYLELRIIFLYNLNLDGTEIR